MCWPKMLHTFEVAGRVVFSGFFFEKRTPKKHKAQKTFNKNTTTKQEGKKSYREKTYKNKTQKNKKQNTTSNKKIPRFSIISKS